MNLPDLSEYSDPKYESLIRENQVLQATLRARNGRIDSQQKQIDELQVAVTETETLVLSCLLDSSRLAVVAAQLGLAPDDALRALELGAHAVAAGFTAEDFGDLLRMKSRWRT